MRTSRFAPGHRLASFVALAVASASCGSTSESTSSQSSPNAGPKCGATPTLLLAANDLVPPVAGDSGSDDASMLEVPASGISSAMDVAVTDTDVFVAANDLTGGALLRIPVRGGAAVRVATFADAEQGLVAAGSSVVFADSAGTIVRVDPQGTTTTLATASIPTGTIFGPSGILATDGTNIVFAARDGTKTVPLAGGAVRTLSAHTGSVTIAGTDAVIADTSTASIYRVPIAGGAETTLATGLAGDLGPIVACGANLCWASAVEVAPSEQGTASLMQLAPGGTPTVLSQSPSLYVVYRLLFDGSTFFLSTLADVSIGDEERVAASGGAPTSTGQGSGIAIDEGCVYTADALGGVFSVAKSSTATDLP